MSELRAKPFDVANFLAQTGLGRKILTFKAGEHIFTQGACRLCVLPSDRSRKTHRRIGSGQGSYHHAARRRRICWRGMHGRTYRHADGIGNRRTTLKIQWDAMIRVMHEQHTFSDMFVKFLLARSIRTQADLVDQLFNSSEKRLARILLLMAEFGKPGEPETLIPRI